MCALTCTIEVGIFGQASIRAIYVHAVLIGYEERKLEERETDARLRKKEKKVFFSHRSSSEALERYQY